MRNPQSVSDSWHRDTESTQTVPGASMKIINTPSLLGWMELGENFDQQSYIDALARRGINTLLLWSSIGITDQAADQRIGYDAPEVWPWGQRDAKFNLLSWNEDYFRRLRSLAEMRWSGSATGSCGPPATSPM